RSTDDRIAQLQRAVRAQPLHADASAALGLAYLQKVRESGDVAYYARAGAVLRDALRRAPANLGALVGMGQLALARHDFGGAPANVAYVQTLLGNLEFERGRLGAARFAYRSALAGVPRYPAADAGLARIDAARGRLGNAIARLRGIVTRLPLPQHVVALGE